MRHFSCILNIVIILCFLLRFRGPILPPRFERRRCFSSLLIQIAIGFLSLPSGMWRPFNVDSIPTRNIRSYRMVRKQFKTVPNLTFGLDCKFQTRQSSCSTFKIIWKKFQSSKFSAIRIEIRFKYDGYANEPISQIDDHKFSRTTQQFHSLESLHFQSQIAAQRILGR